MHKEWKDKWIAALRSGEYGQAQRRLRRGNDFCCIGVLCDIVAKEHPEKFEWIVPRGNENETTIFNVKDVNHHYKLDAPVQVLEIVGCVPYSLSFYISLNDDKNSSFYEIANCIEARE